MSKTVIEYALKIDDNGSLNLLDGETKKLVKSLEKAKKAAADLKMPAGATMEAAKKSASSAAKSAAYDAAAAKSEGQAYDKARGTISTGAAGRDFSNQAQGLGGLVRLYATYAANVFAVGTAFNALREAMNTTNMVEGLNQLGAATGVAMGTVAKKFAETAGGAISLRESVEATAKAMSSGLSQDQFLKLGAVAKGASQALGVNMSDAVSRLTRGITKLEPELLDELGIFTKVGTATEAYAKSIGKSANALTDFERRQAFANAVLDEGAAKFGAIDIPTNPYDKLAASMKTAAQTIGEGLNTVVVPLVDALSKSPVALYSALAAVTALIAKQALPTLGNYRKELAESSRIAGEIAKAKVATAQASVSEKDTQIAKLIRAMSDEAVNEADKAEAKLNALRTRAGKNKSADSGFLKQLSKKASDEITNKDLDELESRAASIAAKNTKNSQKMAEAYREYRKALMDWRNLESQATEAQANAAKKAEEQVKGLTNAAALNARIAAKAERVSFSRSATSTAAETTETLGAIAAFKELRTTVSSAPESIGATRKAFTLLTGSLAIATTAATAFVNAFSTAIMIFTLVGAGLAFLYDKFRGNSKEAAALGSEFDNLNSTMEVINKTARDSSWVTTTNAIHAQATAIGSLNSSITATTAAFDAALSKESRLGSFGESIKSFFGFGQSDELAKAIEGSVESLYANIRDPKALQEAKDAVKEIFGTFNPTEDMLDEQDRKELIVKFKKLGQASAKALSEEMAKAEPLKTFQGALKTAVDESVALTTSLSKIDDPIAKTALATSAMTFKFLDAGKSVDSMAAAIKDLGASSDKLVLLPAEQREALKAAHEDIRRITEARDADRKKLKEIQDEELKLQRDIDSNRARYASSTDTNEQILLNLDKAKIEEDLRKLKIPKLNLEANISVNDSKIKTEFNKVSEILRPSLVTAISLAMKDVDTALGKADVARRKSLLGTIPKNEATIKASAELDKRAIDIQLESQRATYNLITSTDKLRISNELIAKKAEIAALGMDEKMTPLGKLEDLDKSRLNPKYRRYIELTQQLNTLEYQQAQLGGKNITKNRSELETATRAASVYGLKDGSAERLQELVIRSLNMSRAEGEAAISKLTVDQLAKIETFNLSLDNAKKARDEEENRRRSRFDSETDTLKVRSLPQAEQDQRATDEAIRRAGYDLEEQVKAITAQIDKIANAAKVGNTPELRRGAEESIPKLTKQKQDLETDKVAILQDTIDKETFKVAEKALDKVLTSSMQVLDTMSEQQDIAAQTALNILNANEQELARKKELGLISEDAYNKQASALAEARASKEKELELEKLQLQYITKRAVINGKLAKATAPEDIQDLVGQLGAEKTLYEAKVDNVNRVYEANKRVRDQYPEMSTRMKSYTDLMESSFDSMADALIEFTKTGKLNMSDMIESMIADILKLEMRMAWTNLKEESGGSGGLLGGLLKGVFGMFGGDSGNVYSSTGAGTGVGEFDVTGMMLANGGAFNQGVMKFAKGGTFTNTVVDTPTMFKFAKGTGLMGEAGPEAIMPLTRDSSGKLGVSAPSGASGGSANVSVNIINNTTEKAEAKETTDSRGNRKIEVIIGDMVAAELARPNSAVQNGMRNTFGNAPTLVRR